MCVLLVQSPPAPLSSRARWRRLSETERMRIPVSPLDARAVKTLIRLRLPRAAGQGAWAGAPAAGKAHGATSRTTATLARRFSHQTPSTSTSPTQSRFHTPYLETPATRGRWFTGCTIMIPPWAWIRVGM